jgi:VIT1/CCC1 family predicted Fe2+/Mn2+ transporter
MDDALKRRLLEVRRGEITEHLIYIALARRERSAQNRAVFERIAAEERSHYDFWTTHTGASPGPDRFTVMRSALLARLFGVTFVVKRMESGENGAQSSYAEIARAIPEAARIAQQESEHERYLVGMIDEERLHYIGSMILGLSDALVELTGALAGFTLALGNTRLIAMTGLITGIAAALSMASSEYLSTKAESPDGKSPAKAAVYTGIAYILTVAMLIAPFLLFAKALVALPITIAFALLIILLFSWYVSVTRDVSFGRRFAEMAGLSLGVAAVSFGIGWVVRATLGVEA